MNILCLFKPSYKYCTVFILLNLILCCCSNYFKKREYGYTFTVNLYGGQAHPNQYISWWKNKTMVIFILPLCTVINKLKSSFSAMLIFHDSCKDSSFPLQKQRQTSHLLHSMLMYILLQCLQCPFFVLTGKCGIHPADKEKH